MRAHCFLVLVAQIFLLVSGPDAGRAAVPLLRISTENPPEHVQTRMIGRFLEELEARAGGRIEIEFAHSASLYRDRDAIVALQSGKVEMVVAGIWQLDSHEPSVGLLMMPALYGLSAEANDRFRDSAVGLEIAARLERALGAVVLGRWIDLGFAHVFSTTRPVRRHADLAGMRIRLPGGEISKRRLVALGAEPVVVTAPDLPLALRSGWVDALVTTYETVRQARLWDYGVRYAFEDRQYFAQYVPLIAADFWARLPEDLQSALRAAWEAIVDEARAAAARAQAEAEAVLRAQGVIVVAPSPAILAQWRQHLRQEERDWLPVLGIDPGLFARAEAQLAADVGPGLAR